MSADHRIARATIAAWFPSMDDYEKFYEIQAAVIGACDRSVPWRAFQHFDWPIVPVFGGRRLDYDQAEKRFGFRFVEGLVFGFPSDRMAGNVADGLRDANLPWLLGVEQPSSRPDEDPLHFPLQGLLTHGVFLVLTDASNPIKYDRYSQEYDLEVIMPADEGDRNMFEMAQHDLNLAAPLLLRMIAQNLRRRIKEPKKDDPPSRHYHHAMELRAMGAHRLAGLVAAKGIENVLVERLKAPPPVEPPEKTILGWLISRAFNHGKISEEERDILLQHAKVRASCAHGLMQEDEYVEDDDLRRGVNRMLAWLSARV